MKKMELVLTHAKLAAVMLECCGWLPGRCYMVARVVWMVDMELLCGSHWFSLISHKIMEKDTKKSFKI